MIEPVATGGRLGVEVAPDLGEPARIVLVRHGATAHTRAGRIGGRDGADPGLSDRGQVQAELAATTLRGLFAGHQVRIVTSSLLRARATGRIIAAVLGTPAAQDARWDEQAAGEWDGLTWSEIASVAPDAPARMRTDADFAPPGGESFAQVARRVRPAWHRLTARGGTTVVVSHRGPLDVVLGEVLGIDRAAAARVSLDPGSFTWTRVWKDGGVAVDGINDVAHLR